MPPRFPYHHSLQPQLDGFCTETLSPVLLESFKIQYLQFLAYTKTPQYKASLQQLLDQEKVRGDCFCVPSTLQKSELASPQPAQNMPCFLSHSLVPTQRACCCLH